jgi:hypothetical protein
VLTYARGPGGLRGESSATPRTSLAALYVVSKQSNKGRLRASSVHTQHTASHLSRGAEADILRKLLRLSVVGADQTGGVKRSTMSGSCIAHSGQADLPTY